MEASRLTIECRFFGDLNDVIRAACGARNASWTSPQFEYIQSYLQRGTSRAKTIVVEKPYVDRHYLEEYGAYYFSAFRNGGPTTTRIHFFDTKFDRNELSQWVQAARGTASTSGGAYAADQAEACVMVVAEPASTFGRRTRARRCPRSSRANDHQR